MSSERIDAGVKPRSPSILTLSTIQYLHNPLAASYKYYNTTLDSSPPPSPSPSHP